MMVMVMMVVVVMVMMAGWMWVRHSQQQACMAMMAMVDS
jgi:hypothetical protein